MLHDKTVKEQQKKFEARLKQLDEDIKKKKEKVANEDITQREGQLQKKEEIEKNYREKLEAIRNNLNEKEQAIQADFENNAKTYNRIQSKTGPKIAYFRFL